ncbi:F-box domain protein [Penicillium canariense]|uniref:F-box domain protein n=1 Tax=Penicillium canariense TaxID=189055 RepID=A0A9W9LTX4_9EURO|nr:F-box domain protein [Penicillium canariense]KAJ5175940.1 F-box domain protein [Penicillium canariense]
MYRTCRKFSEPVLYILRSRMGYTFDHPEPNLLLKFGPTDTVPADVKCRYLSTSSLQDSLPGRKLLADVFAVFRPTSYSPASTPWGGSPANELLKREVILEDFEQFAQVQAKISLVSTLATLLITGSTNIGGTLVVRLQRDWLESQRSEVVWLDQQHTLGIRVEVRRIEPSFATAYEVTVTELHVSATRLLVAIEKAEEKKRNRNTSVIRLRADPHALGLIEMNGLLRQGVGAR